MDSLRVTTHTRMRKVFWYYQGREDDIFKSAGEKVSAREVEDVVLTHEDIAEAAVVSQPDAILGAVPVAVRGPAAGHILHRSRPPGVLRKPAGTAQSASSGSFRRRASKDGERQDSETLAQADVAAMISAEAAQVSIPWGCWSQELGPGAPVFRALHRSGQRHAGRAGVFDHGAR